MVRFTVKGKKSNTVPRLGLLLGFRLGLLLNFRLEAGVTAVLASLTVIFTVFGLVGCGLEGGSGDVPLK